MPAALYVVATPIGNLEDITLRAIRILREVDLIACEDTRQTQKLLAHYEIRKPLVSYHDHNESSRTPEIVNALENGQSVALVSDAGTPLLSDPGYRLVSAAIEKQISVIPIPGPSAALAAVAVSGLPTDQFLFAGFLPPKTSARRKRLQEIAAQSATAVIYESPHRVIDTLSDMSEVLGDRTIVLARELTKVHEELLRGTAREVRETLQARPAVKGEITIVIGRDHETPTTVLDPAAEVDRLVSSGLDRMDAIKTVARQLQVPKREVYRLAAERDSNPAGIHRDSDRTDR